MVMNNPFSLAGKVALITGGATGLGLAMAQCMVQSGAHVIIASRNLEKCEQAAASLTKEAALSEKTLGGTMASRVGSASACALDVTDSANVNEVVATFIQKHGHIDILCNNAGNHCKKPITQMSVDDFTSVLTTHVVGSFVLTKALVPYMQQQGGGNIQFTASMTSFLGMPNVVGYSAAKAAFLGMIHSLSTELAPFHIRVNGIAPGWIETTMLHQALDHDEPRKNKILQRTPLGCFGQPADIGWASVYLASPASSFVTGQVLVVDGGALNGF